MDISYDEIFTSNLKSLSAEDRRFLVIAKEQTAKKICTCINWGALCKDLMTDYVLPHRRILTIGEKLKKLWDNDFDITTIRDYEKYKKNKEPNLCFADINKLPDDFHFPPNHPIDGVLYACSDTDPDNYFPFCDFHKHMYQMKLSAFKEMCSFLGAKSCKTILSEDITKEMEGSFKITSLGSINANGVSSNKLKTKIDCSFPKPKNGIREYKSRWLDAEPTWRSLQKDRLDRTRDISKIFFEFNYNENSSINANMASNFKKIGLNLGGEFQEVKIENMTIEIEFWDIE